MALWYWFYTFRITVDYSLICHKTTFKHLVIVDNSNDVECGREINYLLAKRTSLFSRAVLCDSMIELWQMKCGQEWCMPHSTRTGSENSQFMDPLWSFPLFDDCWRWQTHTVEGSWVWNLPWRGVSYLSKILPLFYWMAGFLIIKFWELFIYSGCKFFIRYMICKYFISVSACLLILYFDSRC